MPVVTPEDRSTQGPDELHIGLEVPRHAARQIHLWAEQQDWPEGTELERPEEYHVTLLYTPGGHDLHQNAWWIDHMEETEVGVRGVTSFGAQEKGFAYVLLLDSPEIRDHAEMLQERAEAMGLEVTHFPGGYKPHITVAYGPTRLPTKPEVPNWRFHVGPSSVSEPRTEKTSVKEIVPHYHPWTGLICHCAWGSPKPRRGRQTRTAGVEGRKLLKAPDKAWRTPKGDEFRQHLAQLPEEYDPLLPYLAQRYKRGDVRLQQVPGGNEGEKRLRYIDNYQWPQHQIPRREGPAAPVWRNLTGPYHLDKWLQWYNARQHPTRRGVNIMDPNFTPVQLQSAVRQHQEALRQEQEKVNWLSNYGAHARPEHVFGPEMYEGFSDPESDEAKQFARKYWGWQVAPLDAHQAEGDSEALGHCIGRDDQPYKHNIDIGNIQAFSLRDKEGYPHVSWHINPSGDSIGHMQGKSGYPNDEYRQLISTFNEARGYPDEESSYEEELEEPEQYDTAFEFPAARDMEDYIQYHHPEDRWEYAHQRANFDPEGYGEEDLYNNTPSWRDIASDYLNNGGAYEDKFYETLRHEGHWGPMTQGLKDEADHDDESHLRALNEWNGYAPAQHEIEAKPPPANEVDKYNKIHNEGNFPAWPDDWGHLARDYLDYYDNYSSAGHPTIGSEYDQFHTNLGENGHAPNMRKALMANIDWDDPEHQWAAQTWNYGMPHHNIHPPEPQPEVSPNQFGFQWSPVRHNWEDPTLGIEDRLRQYTEQRGTFSRVAYNPDHVEADDSASLQAVAAQLHYRHEQTGSLNAQQATDYASRILHTLGYPTDQITLQAALQAWQSEYPEDKVVIHTHVADYFPGDYDTSWIHFVDPVPGPQVGVRRGVPGISEHLGSISGERGTGHFGTGVYFASSPEAVHDGIVNPRFYGIDLSGYSFYRPRDFHHAMKVHDTLRDINTLAHGQPGEGVDRGFSMPRIEPEDHTIRMASYTLPGWPHNEQVIRDAIDGTRRDLAHLDSLDPMLGRRKHGYQYDSASTRVMRGLGYDGVDTRHISGADNTMYGSVLYRPLRNEAGPEKFGVTQGELSQSLGQDDEVGLLAGSAHRTSQHGYVSPELQQIIDAFGNRYGLTLGVNETPNAVSFDHIEIPPEARGTGAGSRMMKQLKSYADRHGKPLKVEHVVNYPFFNRFDWMQPTGSDEYTYVPQSAPDRSTVPTQVNNPSDHWPEFGELPPDQHRDLGFSDDWAWHQG